MKNSLHIITVLGARPQFIKAACVSRAIAKFNTSNSLQITETILHTGQHFDYGMSDVFFESLQLPNPKYNLGISSLPHGAMLGRMIERTEEILLSEKPDIVLVYGDTNSTLAGALAAVKLHIPVAHVEAGLRSHNNNMPEEINRILTDRISSILFTPTDSAEKNLQKEGFEHFGTKIIRSGDVMFDSLLFNKNLETKPQLDIPENFILSTLHRPETLNDFENLNNCLDIFKTQSPLPVLLIIHPGTRKKINGYGIDIENENLIIIPPLNYHEMLYLLKRCRFVATDSGGLQKEAFWSDKYCLTLRNETEWTELVENGFNFVCGYDPDKIRSAMEEILKKPVFDSTKYDFYGNGGSAGIICNFLAGYHKNN